ncbi:MAG: DUF1287 domain-containing protein [Solirubrobacterales bacterium]
MDKQLDQKPSVPNKLVIGILIAPLTVFLLVLLVMYATGRLFFFQPNPFGKAVKVPTRLEQADRNRNGVPDPLDLVREGRREILRGTIYDGRYYASGSPPEGRGACSDVIWRAYRGMGFNLKAALDADIQQRPALYGATGRHPDPAIDYRRVRNQKVYFAQHGKSLTVEVVPGDAKNLVQWQAGDLVVFDKPKEHIAIISDKRRRDGVPLLIHNCGPVASESDYLLQWPTDIVGHYRFLPE